MLKRMNLVMKRLVMPENNNNNNAEVGRQSRQAEVGPKIIIKFPFK